MLRLSFYPKIHMTVIYKLTVPRIPYKLYTKEGDNHDTQGRSNMGLKRLMR